MSAAVYILIVLIIIAMNARIIASNINIFSFLSDMNGTADATAAEDYEDDFM